MRQEPLMYFILKVIDTKFILKYLSATPIAENIILLKDLKITS